MNVENSIGIITYDAPHLKTEQVVHKLLRRGFKNIKIVALPFSQRPERETLIKHRPNQFESIPTKELAASHSLDFHKFNDRCQIPDCDYYLITGAGILPAEIIENRKIINAHPGAIPAARGLDSFKWSIYNNIPLGVTLHYIDKEVDAGEIITILKTPIYKSDTISSIARRHYELEIDLLANFDINLENTSYEKFQSGEVMRRMPTTFEAHVIDNFEYYKAHQIN